MSEMPICHFYICKIITKRKKIPYEYHWPFEKCRNLILNKQNPQSSFQLLSLQACLKFIKIFYIFPLERF